MKIIKKIAKRIYERLFCSHEKLAIEEYPCNQINEFGWYYVKCEDCEKEFLIRNKTGEILFEEKNNER